MIPEQEPGGSHHGRVLLLAWPLAFAQLAFSCVPRPPALQWACPQWAEPSSHLNRQSRQSLADMATVQPDQGKKTQFPGYSRVCQVDNKFN